MGKFTCNRTVDFDKRYDSKIHDNTTGSIKLVPSEDVRLTGIVTRRLFKTLIDVDFDVALDAVVTVKQEDGTVLGSLGISETLHPTRSLCEKLRESGNSSFSGWMVSAFVSMAPGFLTEAFTSGECTQEEVDVIKRAHGDPSSLGNAPSIAQDSRFRSVPMVDGHWCERSFGSPIHLEGGRSYIVEARIRRRGWYKLLYEEQEDVNCKGVIFKFKPRTDSHVVNAILSAIVFTK